MMPMTPPRFATARIWSSSMLRQCGKTPANAVWLTMGGAVAMARLPDSVNPGRESNGSQFYICVVDSPSLDDQYTVFGHVIKGMDVVDAISNQARDNRDNPINRIEMEVTLEPKEQALLGSSASSP